VTALRLDAPSPKAVKARPLRLVNLLNDLDTLLNLLHGELDSGTSLNAFLLAAGVSQVTEDYLQSDRGLLIKAAAHMASSGKRVARIGASSVRAIAAGRAAVRRWWSGDARVEAWLEDVNELVTALALAVMGGAAADQRAVASSAHRVLAGVAELPRGLRTSVIRLPSSFRSFDQHPVDMARLAAKFAARTPDRTAPVMVAGVRTSGSYLAPLVSASLHAHGFLEVSWITSRPGVSVRDSQRAAIRRVKVKGGTALVVDDPPTTGDSIQRTVRTLIGHGLRRDAVVVLVGLSPGMAAPPELLQGQLCIALLWDEWSIHERLAPAAVVEAMADLLGDRRHIVAAERVSLEAGEPRCHAAARYRVKMFDRQSHKTSELDIHAGGVGLGYFGEHSLEVAERIGPFSPRIHGLVDGVLFRDWLPSARRLDRTIARADARATRVAVDYVLARHSELRVPHDTSVRLRGRLPAWEATSNLVSQAFGRAWAWARVPLVDPLVKRSLRVDTPSIVDGSMAPAQWFAGDSGRRRTVKIDADRRAFANLDLASYDPVFDLASLSADAELAAPEASLPWHTDEYRAAFEARTSKVAPERWFLLQLLHLWDRLRLGDGEGSALRRAMSRVAQRYFAEVYLQDAATVFEGSLVALDIDGVLEGEAIAGVTSLTRSSALALRALQRHGYRPVLMTGRSLADVEDRCATLGLAGGVAEYGSVLYDARGSTVSMLSEHRLRNVARAREAIARVPGVQVDPAYRYSVRAFMNTREGRRRAPDAPLIEDALQSAGLHGSVEVIVGDSQVDVVAVDASKGTGLAKLAHLLGAASDGIALAVGDGPRDIDAFRLARLSVAPAHAPAAVRAATSRKVRRPYQLGLYDAVRLLIGHRPGTCRRCRMNRMPADRAALIALLSAQERGVHSMADVAAKLAFRNLWELFRR
jgi:hydroxymethylpyrimidine pyrophosphatase-like HAD family hydrolase